MGFRNPFRFSVNRQNGDVYVGDYSPDAQAADPACGPEGIGRWMIVREPVNFGWPFCITPDTPYVDHDFTPDAPQSGEEFNCFGPTNDSRNNTGLTRAAAGRAADVWYPYRTGADLFPELFPQNATSNGIGPMGQARSACGRRAPCQLLPTKNVKIGSTAKPVASVMARICPVHTMRGVQRGLSIPNDCTALEMPCHRWKKITVMQKR